MPNNMLINGFRFSANLFMTFILPLPPSMLSQNCYAMHGDDTAGVGRARSSCCKSELQSRFQRSEQKCMSANRKLCMAICRT